MLDKSKIVIVFKHYDSDREASLVAQLVKNLPAMQETWVQSMGWEDPLEEGMATHSSILAWRIPMDRGAWWATDHGVTKCHNRATKHKHVVPRASVAALTIYRYKIRDSLIILKLDSS